MRVSDYTIVIPIPESNQTLLVHGYSGAVDVVSLTLGNWLHAPDFDASLVSPEVFETLKKRGYLTEKTLEEERAFVEHLGRILHRGMSNTYGFILMPTYNCNLRCFYCFETHIRSRPYFEQVMSQEMVDAAYTFMEGMTQSSQRPSKQITLYGGEPLMRQNYETVAYIIRRGLELGYLFKAVTNGVDLDAYLEFLGPGQIEFLQITLDGPPRAHDQRRIRAQQYGARATFEDIAQNITASLERGIKLSVRSNIDALNMESLAELEAIYQERGWRNYPNFTAYAFPAHGKNPDGKELYLSEIEMIDTLSETETEGCARCNPARESPDALIDVGHNFINRFKQLLTNGRYPLLQAHYCSAHTGMFLLGPLGDLYACWDHVGDIKARVGQYYPTVQFDAQALDAWRGRTTFAIQQCRECTYALLCGGGCAYQALMHNGTLYAPNCNNFGELFTRFAPRAYQEYMMGDRELRHTTISRVEPDGGKA